MQDVDGRDCELPVGDAKVTQVGPGMAGEASPSVKASPAEVTAHQAEGARVKVSHCGDREDIDCLSGGWGVCVCVCVTLHLPLSSSQGHSPSGSHTPCWSSPWMPPCPLLYMLLPASAHLKKLSLPGLLLSPFTQLKASGTSPPEILLQDRFAVIWTSV